MSNKILYIFISIIISQYSHTYGCDKNIVIYQGTEYRISDNNLTFCLLDHLTAQNTDESKISENLETFFYICKISDGALSEALSPYCMKVALRYTHEFIEKLETDTTLIKVIGLLISDEFYFNSHSAQAVGGIEGFIKKLQQTATNKSSNDIINSLKSEIEKNVRQFDY